MTTSFTQVNKHESKSNKFQVITPSEVQEVLRSHGFERVHLKESRAKHADKQSFQTTIARYRSQDDLGIAGLNLDIIFKMPHLYGKVQAVLGLFRGTCSNQLNVGTSFEDYRIAHKGDALQQIDRAILNMLSSRQELVKEVENMKSTVIDADTARKLAGQAVYIRADQLKSDDIKEVSLSEILKTRRNDDEQLDLFTTFNVIQENIVRRGILYKDSEGNVKRVRSLKDNSNVSLEFNKRLWDAANHLTLNLDKAA